jgi:hypothetical protein
MSKAHLEPAASIIRLLGGLSAVADALSTTTTTVQRWRRPREKGGTDGYIPRWWHGKIIATAEAKGIQLPPTAFIDAAALPTAA